ncbi:hypothetical protein PCO31010_01204 [Pandoraea commovens]|uniref:Uncharacterized protein n=1 Tax=Pandoraea commovens TaxID=2508289 RepID=A0A5E4T7R3_9BURK|nr:hypothetical protein PCO31010_01204 [Pandoraea commovens]
MQEPSVVNDAAFGREWVDLGWVRWRPQSRDSTATWALRRFMRCRMRSAANSKIRKITKWRRPNEPSGSINRSHPAPGSAQRSPAAAP